MTQERRDSEGISVSVIVFACDTAEALCSTLDSILAQTLENIEIIVISNGLTDATGQVLENYKKSYSKKIIEIHQQSAGISKARNMGLEAARGEYVGFVETGDTVEPSMFEEMYLYAKEKNSDLVQCWRYKSDRNLNEKIAVPKKCCTGVSIYETPEIFTAQTSFVWDKIFRRTVIEEHKITFQPFQYCGDILFIFQFELFASNIEELETPFYHRQPSDVKTAAEEFNDSLLDAPKAWMAINNLALQFGCFSSLERCLWRRESKYYIKRVRDFWLYRDNALQERIAKAYFDLFDQFFFGWRTTIRKAKSKKKRKKIQVWTKAYLSDWDKMLKFIYCPRIWRRICRKTVHLIKTRAKWKEKLSKKVKKMKTAALQKIKAGRYAKYRTKPVKANAVLLTAYAGRSFSDSIYYLAKDLMQREELTVYVATNSILRELTFINYNQLHPILVDIHSKQYLKLLATAQYLVCNDGSLPWFFYKRKGQIYLNTWHGTPLKTLGKHLRHGLRDVGNSQGQFLMCDYLSYPNEYTRRSIMESYFLDRLYTGKVIMCGYPRNAAFFDTEDAVEIRKKMGLQNKRVYVYMPTWRGESVGAMAKNAYARELGILLETLDNLLCDDVVIFIKLHYFLMNKLKVGRYKHLFLPNRLYENYRFVNISDGLITDYSSVFFDYANSQKEIILFTYDYEEYMEQRGMYFNMNSLPFPRIDTVEALAEHLNRGEKFTPDKRYLEFCSQYCKYDSINSPEYINDIMLSQGIPQCVQVEDYEQNAQTSYHIYFMSSLKEPEQRDQFEQLADASQENDLFVFTQRDFTKETDQVLAQYVNSDIQYIVVRGGMPTTISEYIKLRIYRKFGLFKGTAKRIYSEELNRVFPNLGIASITNYSNDPTFCDICRVLGAGDKT